MSDARAVAAVAKQLKLRGAKARRGHLRLQVGDLWWYVDPRIDRGRLSVEAGCWPPALPPEPDGGAVDCPLLLEVALEDPSRDVDSLLDLLSGIGDLDTLARRLDELPGALVDNALRDLLSGGAG